MLRNRTTVKVEAQLQSGLFLQPFIVSQLVGAVIERVVDGSDVSASEYAVTSSVGALGSVSPTELARLLGLSPTTLSAIVERLVRKKELRRVPHEKDGRSYVLELTAKGIRTNERNSDRFLHELSALERHLDDKPEELLNALRSLEAGLRKTLDEDL